MSGPNGVSVPPFDHWRRRRCRGGRGPALSAGRSLAGASRHVAAPLHSAAGSLIPRLLPLTSPVSAPDTCYSALSRRGAFSVFVARLAAAERNVHRRAQEQHKDYPRPSSAHSERRGPSVPVQGTSKIAVGKTGVRE